MNTKASVNLASSKNTKKITHLAKTKFGAIIPFPIMFDKDLNISDLRLYSIIKQMEDARKSGKDITPWFSYEWLAEQLSCTKRHAMRIAEKLAKKNYIAHAQVSKNFWCWETKHIDIISTDTGVTSHVTPQARGDLPCHPPKHQENTLNTDTYMTYPQGGDIPRHPPVDKYPEMSRGGDIPCHPGGDIPCHPTYIEGREKEKEEEAAQAYPRDADPSLPPENLDPSSRASLSFSKSKATPPSPTTQPRTNTPRRVGAFLASQGKPYLTPTTSRCPNDLPRQPQPTTRGDMPGHPPMQLKPKKSYHLHELAAQTNPHALPMELLQQWEAIRGPMRIEFWQDVNSNLDALKARGFIPAKCLEHAISKGWSTIQDKFFKTTDVQLLQQPRSIYDIREERRQQALKAEEQAEAQRNAEKASRTPEQQLNAQAAMNSCLTDMFAKLGIPNAGKRANSLAGRINASNG